MKVYLDHELKFIADGKAECSFCNIRSFSHLHRPNTLPYDFEKIEEPNKPDETMEERFEKQFPFGVESNNGDVNETAKVKDFTRSEIALERKRLLGKIEWPEEKTKEDEMKVIMENKVCRCEYENYPFCETEKVNGYNKALKDVKNCVIKAFKE